MRFRLMLGMMLMAVLAACGGGSEDDTQLPTRAAVDAATPLPAATVPPEEPVGAPDSETDITLEELEEQFLPPGVLQQPRPSPTPVAEGALPVLPPGTLVVSETEDPLAPLLFDYLRFEQRGGPQNLEIILEIYQDGRVVLNGADGFIASAEVEAIDQLLDDLNFFGLQGNYSGPPRSEDEYRYSLFVDVSGRERMIGFREGYIPRQVQRVLSRIRTIGEAILQPTPVPTIITEEAP